MPLGPLGGGPLGGGPMLPPGGPLPGIGPLGGMHVGPGHPFFSDHMRHPDLGPGGFGGPGHPGGARWDPISERARRPCAHGCRVGPGTGACPGARVQLDSHMRRRVRGPAPSRTHLPPPADPEGLEGWSPDDFQRPPPGGPGRGGGGPGPGRDRGGPPIDPDLEQPGPGRPDWDSMYG
jgi:hypothetical protein